jgi:hypothetical protein
MARQTQPQSVLIGIISAVVLALIAVFSSLIAPEPQQPVVSAPPTTNTKSIPLGAAEGMGVSPQSAQQLLQPAASPKPGSLRL